MAFPELYSAHFYTSFDLPLSFCFGICDHFHLYRMDDRPSFRTGSTQKWWDYSKKRWNLDGYICLQYSILWGILGYIAIQWGNTLILWLWQFIPTFVTYIILWTLTAICCMDITASVLTILHLEHKSPTLIRLNRELFLFKTSFGRALTAHIRRRIQKPIRPLQRIKSFRHLLPNCHFLNLSGCSY